MASNYDYLGNKSCSFQLCCVSQHKGSGGLDHAYRHGGYHFWVRWLKTKIPAMISMWKVIRTVDCSNDALVSVRGVFDYADRSSSY